MTTNTVLTPLVAESQIPKFEVLDAHSTEGSSLFPFLTVEDTPGRLGNYMQGPGILDGSPLYPVAETLKALRTDIADGRGYDRVSTEDKRILMVIRLHSKLISRINQSHLNLIDDGVSPFETTDIIRTHIDEMDSTVAEDLDRQHADLMFGVDCVKAGIQPNLPDYASDVSKLALAEGENTEEKPEGPPPSPEIVREASKEYLFGQMRKNALLRERLEFEWISSLAVLGTLRRSMETGEFAHH